MSNSDFEVPDMPQSIESLFSDSPAYGKNEYDGWPNFCARFNQKGYTCVYTTDICGRVLADFFSYYNVEKVMFANALHVTVRTIHNWIQPDTKSIPLRWHDKLERAIAFVHNFRQTYGWSAIITHISLTPESTSESDKNADGDINRLVNAPVLNNLSEICRDGLEQLSEFYDLSTEKLIYQALEEWVILRLHGIYHSIYDQDVEDESLIASAFTSLDANVKSYKSAMDEMRLNQLALNECGYADEERAKALKEQRVAAAFARQMEAQAERQRKHSEAALERSKKRVKEAAEDVAKALRLMPGDGTFNTFEAHRLYNESLQQTAKQNEDEERQSNTPPVEEEDDIPF